MSLNQAQYQAISHLQGPCMVLAGPGSGKTLTIVKRIEYLIKKYHVSPAEILVVTFTNAAAKEMQARFAYLSGKQDYPVTFGTFHSIFYGILKWAYGTQAFRLISAVEKYEILREIIRRTGIEGEDETELLKSIFEEIGRVKSLSAEPSEMKVISSSYTAQQFQEVYRQYEAEKRSRGLIDFDDMLILCRNLFVGKPDILKQWQQRFRYILVDEFQDINPLQYEVIRMLAEPENNLFVVGDDDQSIYRFRGADPGIMLGFGADYPQAKQILLNINYRSTGTIVSHAGHLIEHNQQRYLKQITALNEGGEVIQMREFPDAAAESRYLLAEIGALIARQIPPEQIAVLYRTGADAGILKEMLLDHNIRFTMKEQLPNIYEHFVGRDILSYLRIANGEDERALFLQIMNHPNRFLGRRSLSAGHISRKQWLEYYQEMPWMQERIEKLYRDLAVLKHITPYAAVQYIRRQIGYDAFLEEYAEQRNISLQPLIEVLDQIEEKAKPHQTVTAWLEQIRTYSEQQKQLPHSPRKGAVSLSSIHGAKGLEYEAVFIIQASEGVLPYKKAVLPAEIEEERRLFYVAVTRAKKKLIITRSIQKNGKDQSPSRFISEFGTNDYSSSKS